MRAAFIVLFFIIMSQAAAAQDFVYKPRNPAFGGDAYNYSWLLSSAESQNKIKDPDTQNAYERDPLADFQSDLNRQILYNLSRKLVSDQFGEGALEPGTYDVGSYHIEVAESAEGLNVSILDAASGTQTSVIVPQN
ncbi:MAG: curli assembly protein CsgF [Bacteroidales bacterium]|nr:curli assembly protein CsgF [Bacteroidales bacterium]